MAFISRTFGVPLLPLRVLVPWVQLALLAGVIERLGIEGNAFLKTSLLALIGFPVHALLPHCWRLRFFILISFIGVVLVLGPWPAAWVLALGALLIALVHLRLSLTRITVLLVLVALALAQFRSSALALPIPPMVWPILASMFMFRLIIWVYDVNQASERPPLEWTLAYFFMLPNACFPLFPVVDFTTLRDRYYSDEDFRIYQRGVTWILRGVFHLVLYRVVYHHLLISPQEIIDVTDLTRFLLANILLYLRVSGTFHLVTGMLHLFGFDLPPTHNRYFLASSVGDFWRRANIYWRDFMLKVVYYPSYFAFKRWGQKPALLAATALVFLSTWFLHSYQWFWLRGVFRLSWQDLIFWGVLGALVASEVLRTSGHEQPSPRAQSPFAGAVRRGLGTAGTFAALTVLWSIWSSASLSDWLTIWRVIPGARFSELLPAFGVLAVVGILGALSGRAARRSQPPIPWPGFLGPWSGPPSPRAR